MYSLYVVLLPINNIIVISFFSEEEAEEELIQVTEKELWSLYDKILSG